MCSAALAKAPSNPIRLAAASPRLYLGDPDRNADSVIEVVRQADKLCVDFLALPELCLTGATMGSFLSGRTLVKAAHDALIKVSNAVKDTGVTFSIGLPYNTAGGVKSCAAIVRGNRIYAIVPFAAKSAPFGFSPMLSPASAETSALTPIPSLAVHSACELFRSEPRTYPGYAVLMPSFFNATYDSNTAVLTALAMYSARTGAAIAYAAPNPGESVSTHVFDGLCAIAAQGEIIASCDALSGEAFVYADVSAGLLAPFEPYMAPDVNSLPFLPADDKTANAQCERILTLQGTALAQRLSRIGGRGFIVGVSGGLDSTLALLACAKACDILGIGRENVLGVMMPGFGSSDRTKSNAAELIRALGCSSRVIDIKASCRQHFSDIGHDEADRNVVYENSQARERTQILLDLSNKLGLLDVGTGDLSEDMLGFCTFGGDHMAQYNVNSSIPKTVIRRIVRAVAPSFPGAETALYDILDTPVSPELLPPDESGDIAQKTEEILGSYELHDIFIWYFLKYDYSPKELFDAAVSLTSIDKAEIYRALGLFLKRVFTQQYKRNCSPECPAIVLSCAPSELVAPSDALNTAWMKEYDSIVLEA